MKVYLNGVVKNDRLVGVIQASEFIREWDEDVLFQWYQRDRVDNKAKIESLKAKFLADRPVDAVTLNLVGDFRDSAKGGFNLNGELHVIDGQQRLRALRDSGANDYVLPVVVVYNISPEEERKLFNELNLTQTKLSFGEHARTIMSPMGDLFRSVAESSNYPIKVTVRGGCGTGVSASAWCNLLRWAYQKISTGEKSKTTCTGKQLLTFLDNKSVVQTHVNYSGLAVKRTLESFVEYFGEYNSEASAYSSQFLLAWCHVVIDNFLDKTAHLNFGNFKNKLEMHGFFQNSYVREVIRGGGSGAHPTMYNLVVEHLNHKKRLSHERLPNIYGVVARPSTTDDSMLDT